MATPRLPTTDAIVAPCGLGVKGGGRILWLARAILDFGFWILDSTDPKQSSTKTQNRRSRPAAGAKRRTANPYDGFVGSWPSVSHFGFWITWDHMNPKSKIQNPKSPGNGAKRRTVNVS